MSGGKEFHLGSLKPSPGSTRRGRYVGRGRASGHGKTSGRGIKGQMSRTGAGRRPGFAGGNLPQMLRIPKRGFFHPGKVRYMAINLSRLEKYFVSGSDVTPQLLAEKGVVSNPRAAIKILADGALTKPLKVSAHAFSGAAREKIAKAGGTCTVLSSAWEAKS